MFGMLNCLTLSTAGEAFKSNAGHERNVSSDSEASVRLSRLLEAIIG